MSNHENHPHLLKGWRFGALIATIILAMGGYILISFWGGWKDVWKSFALLGWKGVSVTIVLSLINYSLRFMRWQHFLTILGHKIPFFQSFRIYIAGFSLTTTPGKAGEALRNIFLKDWGVPYRTSFGAFFSERLSDLLAVLIISIGGLWTYSDTRLIIPITTGLIVLCLFSIQSDRLLKGVESFFNRKFNKKFSRHIEFCIETVLAFRKCFTPSALLFGTVLGMIAWILEGMALAYILHLLNNTVSAYTAVVIYAFSLLVGAVTFLPGGLGGSEAAMIQLLLLNDVSISSAVAATITIRILTLWLSVVLGVLAIPRNKIQLS